MLEPTDSELKAQVLHQCDRISQSPLRIAVFGPFNYGKSTLLNALIGTNALPTDLIPTTGAAIAITYGSQMSSRIVFTDDSSLSAEGTEILHEYTTLKQQSRIKNVEVRCPQLLLQAGAELVDLPGTDDQAVHNQLVRRQLLATDVVIQLLDGRRLMTLTERDQLKDWLFSKGITTVLFVVNFLNLVDPDDRQRVMERLHIITEDFPAALPKGLDRLYRVDALPALRARLKADQAAVIQSGLPALESALHALVRSPRLAYRLPRLLSLATQVRQSLQQQLQELDNTPLPRRTAIQQRIQQLMQTGFQQSVVELRQWLELSALLTSYQSGLLAALQDDTTAQWLAKNLYPTWEKKRRAVVEWVYKACEVFDQPRPVDLWIGWQPLEKSVTPTDESPQLYLTHFSTNALTALDAYEAKATPIFHTPCLSSKSHVQQVAKRTLLQTTLVELQQLQSELNTVKHSVLGVNN